MFLRCTNRKKDGKEHRYWSVVENRRVAGGRVVQRQVLGGTASIPVDVRIITATHRNLEEMIFAGQFREDLWFRLNIFPIGGRRLRLYRLSDLGVSPH